MCANRPGMISIFLLGRVLVNELDVMTLIRSATIAYSNRPQWYLPMVDRFLQFRLERKNIPSTNRDEKYSATVASGCPMFHHRYFQTPYLYLTTHDVEARKFIR